MRRLIYLLPAFLLGAAAPLPTTVRLGVFQTWGIRPATPLFLVTGRLTIRVAAMPCQTPAPNEGCRQEGISNQAVITVGAPGLHPFEMTSDSEASFVRVAVIRMGRTSARLGVVIDNQWGGSAGLTKVTVIEPAAGGFRAVPLEYHKSRELTGELRLLPNGLLKNGQPGFALWARAFNYSNECVACVAQPPLVLTVRGGRSIDVSADPAVRPLFVRDLPVRRRVCVSAEPERNANCAAFVADAARLGRVASAWRVMLRHYRHVPAGYPAALRSFLIGQGYVTPEVARALLLA